MEQASNLNNDPLLPTWAPNAAAAKSPARQKRPLDTVQAHHALLHASTPFSDCEFRETEWVHHHSWTRYLPEPYRLYRLIAALFPPLLWIICVSVACGLYQELRPAHWYDLQQNSLAFGFGLTSFALSLLLVFKTNASYGRWQEAQAAWSSVSAAIPNLVCKVQAFASPETPEHFKLLFARWAIALPYLLRAHLLSYVPGTLSLESLLTKEEYDWLQRQPVMPLAAVQMVGGLVAELKIAPPLVGAVHADLSAYVVALGVCQRLSRAPIPMSYTRHTVRYLLAYLSVLPVALWPSLEWTTCFFAPAAAFLLLGLENIGNQIENPLLVLPMAAYCSSLHVTELGLTRAWSHGKPQAAQNVLRTQLQQQAVPNWQKRPLSLSMMGLALGALSRARSRLASRSSNSFGADSFGSASDPESVPGDRFDIDEAMEMVTKCVGDADGVEDDETAMTYVAARGRERGAKALLRNCINASVAALVPRRTVSAAAAVDLDAAVREACVVHARVSGGGQRNGHDAAKEVV